LFPAPAVAVAASLLLVLPLSGCGIKDTRAFRNTRQFYYTHVNRPAKLNLNSLPRLSGADSRLSLRVMGIDAQLTSLERTLEALSAPPDQAAADNLLRLFPWLSNLILIDPYGRVLASIPPSPMKRLTFDALLEPSLGGTPRDLRVAAQETSLGPEILVARPFLQKTEVQALLVATFDFRSLLPYVEVPDDLLVFTPDILFWSGDLYYSETIPDGTDWAESLRKQSYGTVQSKTAKTIWLARYLGDVALVFATPVGE
jgi:hypothetical protein